MPHVRIVRDYGTTTVTKHVGLDELAVLIANHGPDAVQIIDQAELELEQALAAQAAAEAQAVVEAGAQVVETSAEQLAAEAAALEGGGVAGEPDPPSPRTKKK